jgi:poly-gamma-glutamate capsule biosynthesis protein CapA/YwtB (metallophosphatase superfamily)
MKKSVITLLTTIFVIAVAASIITIMWYMSSNPTSSVSDALSSVSADGSKAVSSVTSGKSETSSNSSPNDNPNSAPSSNTSGSTSQPSGGEGSVVSFLACPDNIIHPSVYADAIERAAAAKGKTPVYTPLANAEYDFKPIYENVAADIAKADLAYINVETLIGGNNNGISGYPMFNSPEASGQTLLDLGFDIFNVAHNHMLDSGNDKYLKNCNQFFKERGGLVIGYYENEADTSNIRLITKNGIKIALLSYTSSTNGISASKSTSYIPYFNETLIRKQVELAKQQADCIIVSAHWGVEDTFSPNSEQKSYAKLFSDLGVDVVVGMHPHVIQPINWVTNSSGKKTLVAYSLGNFISGMQESYELLGGTLSFDIVKDASGKISIENVLFNPTVTHYTKASSKVKDDTGQRNYKIYYLEKYTEELASQHAAVIWDKSHKLTLVGGAFSRENLVKTLKQYISAEFLPAAFK